jgi:predicted nucleic acid-binding protein
VILADTSIWVDHLARGDDMMTSLLDAEAVLMHPFVMGEIALGNLPRRVEALSNLNKLPKSVTVDSTEVLHFIERNDIFGTGIGYVDAHLLVATALTADVRLWTRDKRLRTVTERLAVLAAALD